DRAHHVAGRDCGVSFSGGDLRRSPERPDPAFLPWPGPGPLSAGASDSSEPSGIRDAGNRHAANSPTMSDRVSRRTLLAAGAAARGRSLCSVSGGVLPPGWGSLIGLGDPMPSPPHRFFLPRRAWPPEFDRRQIPPFPAINPVAPEHETYRRYRAGG